MNSIEYLAILLTSLLQLTFAKPQYGFGYAGYNQDGTYNPMWNQPPTFSHLDVSATNNPLYYGDYNYGYNNGGDSQQSNRLIRIWPFIMGCSENAVPSWMVRGSSMCKSNVWSSWSDTRNAYGSTS